MKKIELNIDATALGSSACILNLVRTILGEIPDTSDSPIVGAYREKCLSIDIVYGIAVHGFIDTMFKTKGYYPTAKAKALKLFEIPSYPKEKKPWMSDSRHMLTTCFNVWNNYIEAEATYEILSCPVKCQSCVGNGNAPEPNPDTCKVCDGKGVIEGPATEITFRIKYYEDDYIIVWLCGTIDTVGKFKNGCFAIRDWKTTGSWKKADYFTQYEMSRQLRIYTLACKLMTQHFPDSILGKVGATHMGAFIDGVFLTPNANDVVCLRSNVFQYSEKQIKDFQDTLDDKLKELSHAIKTKHLPKQGILNGTCEQKFSKCRFWHACKSPDNVAQVLLSRDFVRKPFDPLSYND